MTEPLINLIKQEHEIKLLKILLKKLIKIKNRKYYSFYIIHAFAEAKEIEKVTKFVEDYGIKNVKTINLANVICAHTGIGTFSFVAFNLDKDKLPKL